MMGISAVGKEIGNGQLGWTCRSDVADQFAMQGGLKVVTGGNPADPVTRMVS